MKFESVAFDFLILQLNLYYINTVKNILYQCQGTLYTGQKANMNKSEVWQRGN